MIGIIMSLLFLEHHILQLEHYPFSTRLRVAVEVLIDVRKLNRIEDGVIPRRQMNRKMLAFRKLIRISAAVATYFVTSYLISGTVRRYGFHLADFSPSKQTLLPGFT